MELTEGVGGKVAFAFANAQEDSFEVISRLEVGQERAAVLRAVVATGFFL